jgi:hypothetical protein
MCKKVINRVKCPNSVFFTLSSNSYHFSRRLKTVGALCYVHIAHVIIAANLAAIAAHGNARESCSCGRAAHAGALEGGRGVLLCFGLQRDDVEYKLAL